VNTSIDDADHKHQNYFSPCESVGIIVKKCGSGAGVGAVLTTGRCLTICGRHVKMKK